MGITTWIVFGIVVLAVLGLGLSTFVSGLQQGAEKIANASVMIVKEVVAKAKQFFASEEGQKENALKSSP